MSHNEAVKAGIYTHDHKERCVRNGGQTSCVNTCIIKRLSREVGGDDVSEDQIPFCSISQAQLSFHGFKGGVKFFISTHPHGDLKEKMKDDNRDSDFDEDSISRKSDDDEVFDADHKKVDQGATNSRINDANAATNDKEISMHEKEGTSKGVATDDKERTAIDEETKSSGHNKNDSDVSMVMAGGEGYVDFRFGPATSTSIIGQFSLLFSYIFSSMYYLSYIWVLLFKIFPRKRRWVTAGKQNERESNVWKSSGC